MKITALGHASFIVETSDIVLYTDPLVSGVHQEGLFDVFPRRKLIFEKLPKPTHIFVSHQHFDHFDVPSLLQFPRDIELIIPNDDLIDHAVTRIGFETVTKIEDWSVLEIGDTKLTFTPSEFRVPEHGVLVEHEGNSFWNQVDTIVPKSAIRRINDAFDRVSLVAAPWQPLRENFMQYTRSGEFPLDQITEAVIKAVSVQSNAIVLGACGFQYIGEASWANHKTFPISRPRMVETLRQIVSNFGTEVLTLDPGVVFHIEDGRVSRQIELHPGVERKEEWSDARISYRPGTLPNTTPFSTTHSLGDPKDLRETAQKLKSLLQKSIDRTPEHILQRYTDWEAVYQCTIFADGQEISVSVDFSEGPRAAVVSHPNYLANIEAFITQNALRELMARTTTWDNVVGSGCYSSHSSVFKILPSGVEVPEEGILHDLLWLAMPHHALINDKIDREMENKESIIAFAMID